MSPSATPSSPWLTPRNLLWTSAAVAVVTIVLIVTTVADAGLLFHSHNDAWSRWSSSPAIRFGANGEVPSSYAAIVEEQMNELVLDGAVANAAFVAPDR